MKKKLTALLMAAVMASVSCFTVFANFDDKSYKEYYKDTTDGLVATNFTLNAGTPQEEDAIILTWPAVDKEGNVIKANPLKADGQVNSSGYPLAGWTNPTNGMIIDLSVKDAQGEPTTNSAGQTIGWSIDGNFTKPTQDNKPEHNVLMGLIDTATDYPVKVRDASDSSVIVKENGYLSSEVVATSFATKYTVQYYDETSKSWKDSNTSVSDYKHGKKLTRLQADGSLKDDAQATFFLVNQFTEKLDLTQLSPNTDYKIRVIAYDATNAATKSNPFATFETTVKTPRFKEAKPAFPTVEGGGKFSQGGRKGDVYVVTNLTDSVTDPQPGSLRYALTHDRTSGNQTKPRIIVFAVGGTIEVDPTASKGKRKLDIPSNTTILGQTAPGEGITIKGMTLSLSGENIILRYIRSRLGAGYDADGANAQGKNIVVDHCSFEWGVDETFSAKALVNSSIQYNIIANGLAMPNKNAENNTDAEISSAENEVKHGMGSIMNGYETSITHNLWAHNGTRNPRFEGSFEYNGGKYGDKMQFSNNVVYDWGHGSAYGGERSSYGTATINFTNNYFKPGPNTLKKVNSQFFEFTTDSGSNKSQFYINGNVMADNKSVTDNNKLGLAKAVDSNTVSAPFVIADNFDFTEETAYDAFLNVLNHAGASYVRDAQDKRILNEAANGTGHFINDAAEAGGYSTPYALSSATDTDNDGIPDEWETSHGLDPQKNDSANIVDNETSPYDGYSWIEVYACDILGEWEKATAKDANYDIINVTDIKDANNVSVYDAALTKLETGKEYTVTVSESGNYEVLLNDVKVSDDLKFVPQDEGIFNLIVRTPSTEIGGKMSALIPVIAVANKETNYSGFTATDVGDIKQGAEGIASYDSTERNLIIAGGGKIGMTSASQDGNSDPDAFFYDYKKVSGNVTLITKVDTLAKVDTFQKAGIMLRKSLDPKSEFYMTAVTYVKAEDFNEAGKKYSDLKAEDGDTVKAKNVRTVYRSADNASVSHGKFIGVPLKRLNETPNYGWLKLKKTGSTVESFGSLDGVNWISLGSFETNLADEFYVGFAIDAVQDTMSQIRYNAAEFSEITLLNKTASGGETPTVTENLGDVDLNGKVTATDAALVFAYVNGLAELKGESLEKAKVRGNDVLTVYDAELILKKAQDSNFLFPVEE